ncbi:hemagglutinin domain-containing protein [Campylobacter lari]|uniref:two-partner secretion domain-containing protein n=1 Tax=Campylobacter lari TaxID=201 RepID=UPI003990A02A
MKKLANHIILSGVTVSMLFSPLMALPSGGKFTHGTSGSINKPNDKTMNIIGNGKNSVVQWGGGFSIGQGEKVNFGGTDKNYLNIAHGTSKSMIEGLLNAGGNNVFLINPNGVIITKTGTINANRFVASTSSMDSKSMQEFADGKYTNGKVIDYTTFSPVFKPSKAGNVVNMGNINANDVTLQGDKVVLNANADYDKTAGNKIGIIKSNNIRLEGKEVYVDIGNIDGNSIKNINIDAKNKGLVYLNARGYYYNPSSFKVFSKITANNKVSKNEYIGIGSDVDWWYFAKGWNENKEGFRDTASEYRLTNDIDFGANCKNGKCSGQNYASYWIDLNGNGKKEANEFTNMIVGYKDAFTKSLDGQGNTLKNIFIDTTKIANNKNYGVGIFGTTNGASFTNINIDYMGGGINAQNINVGGFAGYFDGFAENISLKKLHNIKNKVELDRGVIFESYDFYGTGGFAGNANGIFRNISLEDVKNFDVRIQNITKNNLGGYVIYGVGGFAGISFGMLDNIYLKDIGKFKIINNNSDNYLYSDSTNLGGFAGYIANGIYNNIKLEKIYDLLYVDDFYNNVDRGSYINTHLGGFAGYIANGNLENIILNDIKNINLKYTSYVDRYNSDLPMLKLYLGGFAGKISNGTYDKIYLYNINNITFDALNSVPVAAHLGGFAGNIETGNFNNITLDNIQNIKANLDVIKYCLNCGLSTWFLNVGGFAGSIGDDSINVFGVPTFKNIFLNEINNISAIANHNLGHIRHDISIGGFAGIVEMSKFENIILNNITNLNAFSNSLDDLAIGGFSGIIRATHKGNYFKNIFLNNINNLHGKSEISTQHYIGGFAGKISSWNYHPLYFENIFLKNITNLKSSFDSCEDNWCRGDVYMGGFVGDTSYGNFKNIYMFFNPNFELLVEDKTGKASKYVGKFYGSKDRGGYSSKTSLSNVHIYYHENSLKDANDDNKDYTDDKIKLHSYNDNNKDEFYQQFKTQEDILAKPIIVLPGDINPYMPSNKPTRPNLPNISNIINEQATLDKDNIISKEDLKYQIIADLKDKFYAVDINTLNDLLRAYKKIDKDNPTSKAEFLANYLLSKNKYSDKERLDIAHSMIQSLDFLLAYSVNNTGKSRLTEEAKELYLSNQEKSKNTYKEVSEKNKAVMNFIKNDLNEKTKDSKDLLKQLLLKQKELDNVVKAYNVYVDLINRGIKSKYDSAFKTLKNNLNSLISESQILATAISNNQELLQKWKIEAHDKSSSHFIIKGAFANAILINPKLNEITNDSGNKNDEYQKISRQIANLQKQTPTFEYEEEETEEVDETSLMQKSKTCIVSDNYKTMNPCIVGGL